MAIGRLSSSTTRLNSLIQGKGNLTKHMIDRLGMCLVLEWEPFIFKCSESKIFDGKWPIPCFGSCMATREPQKKTSKCLQDTQIGGALSNGDIRLGRRMGFDKVI